jgi:hypothetical protein
MKEYKSDTIWQVLVFDLIQSLINVNERKRANERKRWSLHDVKINQMVRGDVGAFLTMIVRG